MTDSMVEGVAKAIHETQDSPDNEFHYKWDDLHEIEQPYGDFPGREEYRAMARAAIEAMRDATPAMIAAGWAAMKAATDPDYIFRAMIDAALAEKDEDRPDAGTT